MTTKGASDFNEWATAIWRFLRSLTITADRRDFNLSNLQVVDKLNICTRLMDLRYGEGSN